MPNHDSFCAAAASRGLVISRPVADGVVRRCRTSDKPVGSRTLNGAYALYESGYGWFQNHADGLGIEKYAPEAKEGRTAGERLEERKRIAAEKERLERARMAAYDVAALRAKRLFNYASPVKAHRYLEDKGVASHGLRADGDMLLVPVQDVNGKWQSLQVITPHGSKTFFTNGKVQGGMFVLGNINAKGIALLGEGYSTMATVFEATGVPSVVAFNCGNLMSVARELRGKYPELWIILCADDDHKVEGNPGITKAEQAAVAVGGFTVKPTVTEGSDFNDMAFEMGIDEVERVFRDVLSNLTWIGARRCI